MFPSAGDIRACKRSDRMCLLLQVTYLLGGGSDFSSGGPGKGMHSRLYQSVLTAKPWVSSCTAYSNIFENTGLLGILMSTPDPSKAPELVDTLCQCASPKCCKQHAAHFAGVFVVLSKLLRTTIMHLHEIFSFQQCHCAG